MKTLWTGGKIYLERNSFGEAMITEGDRILKVGKTKDLEGERVDQVVDLEGKTLLPGLNDSHCHISGVGAAKIEVDLTSCQSVEEVIAKTKAFIQDHPEETKNGLRTMGWNQDNFIKGEKRLLTREDLDQISTEIPLVLERICGHICATNTKVLTMMGLDEESQSPPGGTIEKGEDGKLNGVFTENAVAWVEKVVPVYSDDQIADFMTDALNYALSVGLTSVQSNDVGAPNVYGSFSGIRKIFEEDRVKIRYRHQFCIESVDQLDAYIEGEFKNPVYQGGYISIGPVKMFKDGSLGARTAQMLHGYLGNEDNKGVCALDYDLQKDLVAACSQRGFQVVTHVIGDGAVEETMNAYEASFDGKKNPLRHGLIHCQLTNQDQLDRIVEKGHLVFYQPIFLDYDLHIVPDLVPEDLARTSYAFKTLAERGVKIGYGTDAPVEDLNPFPCIYAAVTRQDKNGYPEGGFFPEEKVDLETAIDAYSLGSAQMEFMEEEKGRIKEGYLADFIVLDRDIFSIPDEEIKNVKVLKTIVGGQVVYEK